MNASFDHWRTGRVEQVSSVRRLRASRKSFAMAVISVGVCFAARAQNPSVMFEWQGTSSNVVFGHSNANVGDIDGGGKDDILVGARPNSGGAGAAYLFRGETGALFATFTGQPNELLGADVAKAGDLDGDGVSEILLGSYGPSNAGRVDALSYSRATGTWTTLWSRVGNPDDLVYHGRAIGDVDGGGPDVLIGGYGANGNMGQVSLVNGMTGVTIRSWVGPQADTSFGGLFDSAPDVDGDGVPDVLIGAPRFDTSATAIDAGRVFLFSGGKDNVLIRSWDGQAGDNLGSPLKRGPDVDHDGSDDLLVGASMLYPFPANTGPGKAFVFSIQTGALLKAWSGAFPGDRASAIGRVGDVNGDGVEDIAVGSPYFDEPSAPDAGKVDVYSGRDLSRLLCTVHGSQAGEALGGGGDSSGAIFAGDLDGDGYAEFAVAAPNFDGPNLTNSGRVLVIAGDVFTPGVTKYGTSNSFCTSEPIPLSVTSEPTPGNTAFAVTAINVPVGSVAIPVIALQPANLHLAWLPILLDFAGPNIVFPPVLPSAPGVFSLSAIPPAGYVGPLVYMQFFFVDVAGTCGVFGGVSAASNALHL